MITLPPITKNQQSIIILIYRYRFLSRLHIQQLLNHKNPQKINLWLKDLTEKNYLNRIYSTKFGDNTKPAIYYISLNGIRYIKHIIETEKKQLHNFYHEKNRSLQFQAHCLNLADFVCNLQAYARIQRITADTLTKVDFMKNDTEIHLILQSFSPDLYYSCKATGIAQACFVEVIDENIPAFVLRRKIRRYIQALQGTAWEALNTDKFPSIAFILPTAKKLNSLKRVISMTRNEFEETEIGEALRCNLTLITDIQTKSITDKIWVKA